MMRPISNQNGLVRYLITLTFGADDVRKQNIVRKKMISYLFYRFPAYFTCKISICATENLVLLPTLPLSNSILRYHC